MHRGRQVSQEAGRRVTTAIGPAPPPPAPVSSLGALPSLQPGDSLVAVATLLRQLNNVNNGDYYIVMYDGNEVDSNAFLYAARATEGDGFDFADVDGPDTGYDADTVELIGVFNQVGGNAFTSQNFVDLQQLG